MFDHPGLKRLWGTMRDLDILRDRREARHAARPDFTRQEPMSQRAFVRLFGTKVRRVHYTACPRFIGLMVIGDNCGFIVNKYKEGRRIRLINVTEGGKLEVTKRYIPLKDDDSVSFLQRGLLRYVQ